MIEGGCITFEGAVLVEQPVPTISLSNGRRGVLLTIDANGVMRPGPGLSRDEATQEAAQMLADAWGRAYGMKLRIAESAIDGERLKARKAVAEMERWAAAARRAGVRLKPLKIKDDDDDE